MSIIEPVIKLACCDVPTIYSNKQSYYECLCYLGYKINECINALNNYGEEWKSYVDEKIQEMTVYVDNKIQDVRVEAANANAELEIRMKELLETVRENLQNQIDILSEREATDILNVRNEMKALEIRLKKYIEEYAVKNILVYDPTTGQRVPVSDALANMYQSLRYWGIDCNEFDSLGVTCDSFDDLNISAHDFDIYAGLRLGKNSLFWMSNPFTGEKDFYQNVIYTLADYHRGSPLTATEYDALQLTATVYDSKQITAYQYDFNGKSLLS